MQNTVDNSRIEQPKTLGPVWIRPEPPVGTVVDECPYFSSLLDEVLSRRHLSNGFSIPDVLHRLMASPSNSDLSARR